MRVRSFSRGQPYSPGGCEKPPLGGSFRDKDRCDRIHSRIVTGLLSLFPSRASLPVPDPSVLYSRQFCASFPRWLPLCQDAHSTLTLITPPFVSPVRSLLRALDSLCPNGPRLSTWTSPNHSKPSTTQTKPIMLSLPRTSLAYWIPPSPHGAFSSSNQKHRVLANASLPRLSLNKCVFFRRLHLFLFSAWMTAVASRLQISPHESITHTAAEVIISPLQMASRCLQNKVQTPMRGLLNLS